MNPIFKNILAVIVGIIGGSVINMGIIKAGPYLIPLPQGADASTMEALAASMNLFKPQHFITPFLAHALGTLVGAFIASKIAANNKLVFALVVSFFFLAGGTANVFMLPAPTWFNTLDLVLAYLPMGWIGHKLSVIKR